MTQAKQLNIEIVRNDIGLKEIGNYHLGYLSENGEFIVKYVGRSDTCLQRRLVWWVFNRNYTHYSFSIARTIKQCFEIECREYHLMSTQLYNIDHPGSPRRLPHMKCPWLCSHKMKKSELINPFISVVGGDS